MDSSQKADSTGRESSETAQKSPKKKRRFSFQKKMVVCRVTLLDGNTFEPKDIDKSADGNVLFDKVCRHLDLVESDYFGLSYRDDSGKRFWLDGSKKIAKQVKGGTWVFEFNVKFYPPDPNGGFKEDLSRYLLCLQLRVDIFNGRLPCSFVTYALLGSYTVQSELGDYNPVEHGKTPDYLKDFDFAPNQTPELLEKIMELHKHHKGLTPSEADHNFLENAKKLAMFGVDLHEAKDSDRTDIMLGVCASGILVYKDKLRINRFVWPKILNLSYKRNNFYIKIRPGEFEPHEKTIGFKLENHKMAKRVWKTCVEHHAFFRLKEGEKASASTLFPRFNSKFRYSGRTQAQARKAAEMVNREQPHITRTAERRSLSYPENKAKSMDELAHRKNQLENNDDYYPDGKDKRDIKGVPTAITGMGPPPDSKLWHEDGKNKSAPGSGEGDAADRRDKLPGEGEKTEHAPGYQGDAADVAAGGLIGKAGKIESEKERKRREKEEEKRKKKEEEDRRKHEEAERKKLEEQRKKEEADRKKKEEEERKKKKGKKGDAADASEDRQHKVGDELATEQSKAGQLGSAELENAQLTLAFRAPGDKDSTSAEKDREKGKGTEEQKNKEKDKSKDKDKDKDKINDKDKNKDKETDIDKDKDKDKINDKHKDKDKDKDKETDKDKEKDKKTGGLFGKFKKTPEKDKDKDRGKGDKDRDKGDREKDGMDRQHGKGAYKSQLEVELKPGSSSVDAGDKKKSKPGMKWALPGIKELMEKQAAQEAGKKRHGSASSSSSSSSEDGEGKLKHKSAKDGPDMIVTVTPGFGDEDKKDGGPEISSDDNTIAKTAEIIVEAVLQQALQEFKSGGSDKKDEIAEQELSSVESSLEEIIPQEEDSLPVEGASAPLAVEAETDVTVPDMTESQEDKKRHDSTSSSSSSASSLDYGEDKSGEKLPEVERIAAAVNAEVEGNLVGGLGMKPGDYSSIDRKMEFIPLNPPNTTTKKSTSSAGEETMPFFNPAGDDASEKQKKVPPPVAPKGIRKGFDSEEDRHMKTDSMIKDQTIFMPPTVPTESFKFNPDHEDIPVSTKNVPIVKTEKRTVIYEKDGIPVETEDSILISSSSHSTRSQTIETTTYKTEKDGVVETRVERKITVTSDDTDNLDDDDDLLAKAILEVTQMNKDMSVEKIDICRQIEESGSTTV